eukprot:2089707-Amphidinium_carterae.1
MQGGHGRKVREMVCNGVATQKKSERVQLCICSSYLEVARQWLSVWSLRCLFFVFVCLNQGWLSCSRTLGPGLSIKSQFNLTLCSMQWIFGACPPWAILS